MRPALFKFALTGLLASLTVQLLAAVPAPPRLGAAAWLLADADSGRILAQHNIHSQVSPASLTKLMTSYVVAHEIKEGRLSREDEVLVSRNAWRTEGSRMFLEPDTWVPLVDILKGIIIQSGNDASVAVAEHISGSEDEFSNLMNRQAQRLGLENSLFLNSTGLPLENHVSTAHDMYQLARALIYDFPIHYQTYSEKFFTYGKDYRTGEPITQRNRNRLLWSDPSVDGIKTGHTQESGYNLVASAKRQGMRLISVVIGSSSDDGRIQDTQRLFTYGFRFFETVSILDAAEEIKPRPAIWGGVKSSVPMGSNSPVWVTLPRGQQDNLLAEVKLDEDLWAPIEKNSQIGVLQVSVGTEIVAEIPVVALDSVKASGLIRRGIDRMEWLVISSVKWTWELMGKAVDVLW